MIGINLCLDQVKDRLQYSHIFWALSINLIIILKTILFNEKSYLKILQVLLQANQSVRMHVVVICISLYHTVNLFESVNTVNITSKPINNMLFVVLAVNTHSYLVYMYICIICVYAKPDCTPIKDSCSCKPKCTSAVRASQKCMHALRAKHDAHSSRIRSHVYMRTTCIDSYIIDLSCP